MPDGSASLAEQIERSLLRPMYTAVRARASDSPGLYRKIENYVTRYLLACGRSASDALAAYERFLRRYMEDVSHFVATGCYPTQAPDGPIGRWEYDAALLLSVLVTEHRYRIMQLVAAHSDTAGRTAVVGVGAGLEVELLKPSGCELHGWDLSLSDAVARLLIRIIRRLGADVGARRTAPPGSTAPRQLTYGPLYALSARLASIRGEPGAGEAPDWRGMVQQLVDGNEAVCRTARKVLDVASKADDAPTEDLATQRLQVHEKNAWMLRSLLQ